MPASTTLSRLALLSAVVLLGACAHRERPVVQESAPVYSDSRGDHRHSRDDRYGRGDRRGDYAEYGVVRALDPVSGSSARSTSGTGAVVGGVAGGVVGRQFGDSSYGRAAGTAVGVLIGAVLGNEIERQNNGGKGQAYTRVLVTMDQGGERRFNLANTDNLRVGDRVRIENNQVYRM